MANQIQFFGKNTLIYLVSLFKNSFVAKENGKGLSTNDFTDAEKSKLSTLSNYTLPNATDTVIGGVSVGSNITLTDGQISLSQENVVAALGYDVYSKQDTDSAIATAINGITKLTKVIVEALPEQGEENIIYMVLKESSSAGNVYNEYLWINDSFELIGDTAVDLTGYVKEEALDSLVSEDALSTALVDYTKSTDFVEITNEEIDAIFNETVSA